MLLIEYIFTIIPALSVKKDEKKDDRLLSSFVRIIDNKKFQCVGVIYNSVTILISGMCWMRLPLQEPGTVSVVSSNGSTFAVDEIGDGSGQPEVVIVSSATRRNVQ